MAADLTKIQRMTLEAATLAGPSSSSAEIYLHLPEGAASFVATYFAIEKLAERGLLVSDDPTAIPRRWTPTVGVKGAT